MGKVHPLTSIIKKFGVRSINEFGGEQLYRRLSTNIHHFEGKFMIDDSQWDAAEGAILQALVPSIVGESVDGESWKEVDWEKERRMFLEGS